MANLDPVDTRRFQEAEGLVYRNANSSLSFLISIIYLHSSGCSFSVCFARWRNQKCNAKYTTTPKANIADMTENPMVYFGPSESGNRY